MQSATRSLSVSLILPVLNQEPRLEDVLCQIRSLVGDFRPEVLLVYDVTRPELLAKVREEQRKFEEQYGVRCVTRTDQRGFGSALRAGFEASTGDVIIPIMGDCSDEIAAIPRMLARIEAGSDLVAGSRYMPGGGIVGDTPKQEISRYYSRIMRAVSTIACDDMSNSFRAYRRGIWESINNEADSFDISVEMTVKAAAQGFRVAQVPAVWTNRQAGQSRFRMLRELPNYSRWLFYAARHVPRRSLLMLGAIALVALVVATGWLVGFGRTRRDA